MNEPVKHHNREKILECALHLFYTKGYDAVAVQEIVNAAGITKPTLYYYFKSKQGVLECLIEENGKAFNQRLREATQFEGDFPVVLTHVMKTFLAMAAEKKEFYLLMIGLFFYARDNEAYKGIKWCMVEQFRIIKEFFQRMSLQIPDVKAREEELAIAFTGTINYYILFYFEGEEYPENLLQEKTIEGLIEQFLYGVHFGQMKKCMQEFHEV